MSSLGKARQKRYKDSHLHVWGEKQCRNCNRTPIYMQTGKGENRSQWGRMIWDRISGSVCPMVSMFQTDLSQWELRWATGPQSIKKLISWRWWSPLSKREEPKASGSRSQGLERNERSWVQSMASLMEELLFLFGKGWTCCYVEQKESGQREELEVQEEEGSVNYTESPEEGRQRLYPFAKAEWP